MTLMMLEHVTQVNVSRQSCAPSDAETWDSQVSVSRQSSDPNDARTWDSQVSAQRLAYSCMPAAEVGHV